MIGNTKIWVLYPIVLFMLQVTEGNPQPIIPGFHEIYQDKFFSISVTKIGVQILKSCPIQNCNVFLRIENKDIFGNIASKRFEKVSKFELQYAFVDCGHNTISILSRQGHTENWFSGAVEIKSPVLTFGMKNLAYGSFIKAFCHINL